MHSRNQQVHSILLRVFFCGLIFTLALPGFANEEPHVLKKITVRILDEHGKPTAARIRVTGKDSVYYAPEGHRVDFPITEDEGDVGRGGDVMLDNNRRFAYVEDTFT